MTPDATWRILHCVGGSGCWITLIKRISSKGITQHTCVLPNLQVSLLCGFPLVDGWVFSREDGWVSWRDVQHSHLLSKGYMGVTFHPRDQWNHLRSPPPPPPKSWDSPRGSPVPTVRTIPKSPREARDVMGLPWGSPHTAPSLLSVPSLSPLGMQGTSWDSPRGPTQSLLSVPSLPNNASMQLF